MDADWYVDPLGRFEGRYFDGEVWTDQVSDQGVLAVDPDWGRDLSAQTEALDSGLDPGPRSRSAFSDAAGADEAVTSLRPGERALTTDPTVDIVDDITEDPAPVSHSAAFSAESAARTVATLDDERPPRQEPAIAAGVDRVERDQTSGSGRRWIWALLGLAALAALAVIALPKLFGGDGDVADPDAPSAQVAGADGSGDADSSDPTAASGAADTGTDGDAMADGSGDGTAADGSSPLSSEDSVQVASYDVVNAKQVLSDLKIWHRGHAEDRGLDLPESSDCWFGVMGNAVVQNAQCGPVRATPGAEPRFDLVPLKFIDVEAGVIRVQPITEAVVTDEVLPNEIELIGRDGAAIDRYELAERFGPPARGERNTSGG